MTLDVQVAQADLGALAGGASPGPLSPLLGVAAAPPGAEERVRELAGTEAAALLLDPVANGRLQVHGGAGVVDYLVYQGRDGQPLVSITAEGDTVRVRQPAPTSEVLDLLEALVGNSALVGVDFETELGAAESLALAALLDLRRVQVLAALAADTHTDAVAIALPDVVRAAAAEPGQLLRIAWLVRSITGSSLTEESARSALGRLVDSGLAAADGGGWVLAGDAADLGVRMLVPELVVTLAGAVAGAAGVERATCTAIVCGVRDVLSFQQVGADVQWQTLASGLLLDYATAVLEERMVSSDAGSAEPAAWRATHRVNAAGLDASDTAGGAAVARLDPGLEVAVTERSGQWAHIMCSNEWTAWVDGTALEEIA